MNIRPTLEARHATHGDFELNAEISQSLKVSMREQLSWNDLNCVQREALDMIALKISRILSGNPNFADHWHDIAGYATLAEKQRPKAEVVAVRSVEKALDEVKRL